MHTLLKWRQYRLSAGADSTESRRCSRSPNRVTVGRLLPGGYDAEDWMANLDSSTRRRAGVPPPPRPARRPAQASRLAACRMGAAVDQPRGDPVSYRVHYLNLTLFGQDVRIADMDVSPDRQRERAKGRAPSRRQLLRVVRGFPDQRPERRRFPGRRRGSSRLGKSSKPILPYSISLHASNTVALLDYLRIAKAAVIGHSIGGQMATRLAFLYPDRITHLVMVNPIGLTDARAGRGFRPFDGEVDAQPDLQTAYEADVRTDLSRYVMWQPEYPGTPANPARRASLRRVAVSGLRARARRQPRSTDSTVNDWPHIKTKSMVLGGERGRPELPGTRAGRRHSAQRRAVLIPDAGHNPHEEVPDKVNAELIRFSIVRSERAGRRSVNGLRRHELHRAASRRTHTGCPSNRRRPGGAGLAHRTTQVVADRAARKSRPSSSSRRQHRGAAGRRQAKIRHDRLSRSRLSGRPRRGAPSR